MNNPEEPNISIYGNQDGTEEFPVLKAFQQYIDAEQAKARRRLLTLGVFFGAVLTAVIVVFAIMLSSASSRVQDLNDRLIEFAMKERTASSANQANDAAFKAMTDTMAMLQREIKERRAEPPAPAAESAAGAVDMAAAARLKREQEALEREKKRLEMERESVYQQTLELQRRRLYPQYYAEEEAPSRRTRRPVAKSRRRVVEEEPYDEDEDLDLDDVEDDEDDNSGVEEDGNLKPIDYFKGDSYEIPVESKGRGTGSWHVPSK